MAGQFSYLTTAYQSRDFVTRAVHCNNALNAAYEKWHKKHPTELVDKETRSKIKSSIDVCLKENGAAEEIGQDVLSRVDNICNPSAIFKLKRFLRGIDLYPEYELSEMHERLQWLNRVRNSMAHTGMLPRDKKLPDDLLGDVTSSIVSLVLRINQYYFGCKVLELDDPYLGYIRGLITSYFYEGKFSGRLVFDERYEEYMERAKEEWLAVDY